jgi:hypothetical protein
MLDPKVDWRKAARGRAAPGRRRQVAGAVDYSYRRPSRRAAVAGDVVLPGAAAAGARGRRRLRHLGQHDRGPARRVLAEVEGLLRALGLARQVRVLACDTAVAPAQRVSSARQVS